MSRELVMEFAKSKSYKFTIPEIKKLMEQSYKLGENSQGILQPCDKAKFLSAVIKNKISQPNGEIGFSVLQLATLTNTCFFLGKSGYYNRLQTVIANFTSP